MKCTQAELEEYLAEIRDHVCSRCIDRPPGGPPCAPHAKERLESHPDEIAHAMSKDRVVLKRE